MFNDGRSKKVIFIAHCLLNQNAISDGTAVYPAAFKDIIDFFLNADISIVQSFAVWDWIGAIFMVLIAQSW